MMNTASPAAEKDQMYRSGLIALLVVCLAGPVCAQETATPSTRLLPYSGVINDVRGQGGHVQVTFNLFDEAEGGTLLWTESQDVEVDAQGRYSTYLGKVTPLPQAAFTTEQARWLEVEIGGRARPRTILTAVPYALRAVDAETLGGTPLSSFVLKDEVKASAPNAADVPVRGVGAPLVDGTGVPGQLAKFLSDTVLGSSVISESATNRVGVGLPDPTGGGVVDSVFTIRNLDNNTGFGILNETQQRRFALNTLANGGWTMYDGGTNFWNQGLTQLNGRVGLGTNTPDARLRVVSTVGAFPAIYATSTASSPAIKALNTNSGSIAIQAVRDPGDWSFGIAGGAAVVAFNPSGVGVYAYGAPETNTATVWATSTTANPAVRATGTLAGYFSGNVTVTGTLSKGGGSFTIDHPLDPENKYLRHSFVESPDMMNVYNGNVELDAQGEAWVTLPEWFETLNRDFRYQLTAIGAPGPNLYVKKKVAGNRFQIAGGAPSSEVSWQVTGIRQDSWANANRIKVEEDKPERERGHLLYTNGTAAPVMPEGVTITPKGGGE